MKSIRLFVFFAGLILVLLCTFIPTWRDWCLSWAFNSIYFIDNLFYLHRNINPIVAWSIVFLFLGACFGLIRAVNRYKLDRKIKFAGIIGLFLVLLLTFEISKPLEYAQSRELREEMLWLMIKKENSYVKCSSYLKEFPNGKFLSEVQALQEQALWDSAMIVNTADIWKLYSSKFSKKRNEAKAYYENARWLEAKKINTLSSYDSYLSEFPKARNTKKAKIAREQLWKKNTTRPNSNKAISNESVKRKNTNDDQKEELKPLPAKDINLTDGKGSQKSSSKRIKGKKRQPSGAIYEGEMIIFNRDTIIEGKGKETFSDRVLTGFWVKNLKNGEFLCTYRDGRTEKQKFENGERKE